jgi:hypothetical protein
VLSTAGSIGACALAPRYREIPYSATRAVGLPGSPPASTMGHGFFALAAGVSRAAGVNLLLIAICLVVIGASLVLRPWIASARD